MARGSLSRELIVDGALAVIDAEGVDGLTMRGLASSLGCEAMSIYKHVPDRSSLIDLVVERVLADFTPPDPTLSWDVRLRSIADEFRRIALSHPHVFPLVAVRLPSSPVALAPVEAVLDALSAAGLGDAQVVSAFWALVAYTTGALVAEAAAAVGTEQPFPFAVTPSDATGLERATGSADALHHVSRLADQLATSDYVTEFHRGLDLLLAAFARLSN